MFRIIGILKCENYLNSFMIKLKKKMNQDAEY